MRNSSRNYIRSRKYSEEEMSCKNLSFLVLACALLCGIPVMGQGVSKATTFTFHVYDSCTTARLPKVEITVDGRACITKPNGRCAIRLNRVVGERIPLSAELAGYVPYYRDDWYMGRLLNILSLRPVNGCSKRN